MVAGVAARRGTIDAEEANQSFVAAVEGYKLPKAWRAWQR
jgi:hypothetical protein